jgi:hypothetical protein
MQVLVGYDYVLIIEWLEDGDRRTGAELHYKLTTSGVKSQLAVCRSAQEVRVTLAGAFENVGRYGIPVIHLETHGTDPFAGDPREISFGCAPGPLLKWNELGPLLAPLNEACNYRLLVVSGACWGSGVLAAIGHGEHPAPFAAAIGFRTTVVEGRLFDAMRELYRALHSGAELSESVESATHELSAGQELKMDLAIDLAAKMLYRVLHGEPVTPRLPGVSIMHRKQRAREVWNQWFPLWLQAEQPAYRFENLPL